MYRYLKMNRRGSNNNGGNKRGIGGGFGVGGGYFGSNGNDCKGLSGIYIYIFFFFPS